MSASVIVSEAISPSPRGLQYPKTPASRRRITPSAETSYSKKTLLLTTPSKRATIVNQGKDLSIKPFYGPKQRFPQGVANVKHQYTQGHPLPGGQHDDEKPWHSRHVLVPYNLRDPSVNIFKGELCSLLYHIFPETDNVTEARFRGYLVFQVKNLPSTPWPVTVGGLPITVSEVRLNGKGCALMFPRERQARPSKSIPPDGFDATKLSDKSLRQLAFRVNDYFKRNLPGVRIIELIFTCERTFFIVVNDYVDIKAKEWPGSIAKYPVSYLHDKNLNRPAWFDQPAKRETEPQPLLGIVDDTAYDVVRPGVMIHSTNPIGHSHPGILSSTAGALVKNAAGNTFITAASHAIGASETVWQPGRPSQVIGKAVAEISSTDVYLIELKENVAVSAQTFEDSEGTIPLFTRLATSDDEPGFTFCYLNSPYTGRVDASIVMKSVRIEVEETPHPTEERLRYVVYDWLYEGQEEDNGGKAELPGGVCGSATWDDDGVIRGFYSFSIKEGKWKGFSACVSASEVVEAGYTLVT
ncbi:hypothetical protein GGR53DRAFT_496267 [Hypoxylon sp. FL1150]|nr:hypothetical protein GGR53DRAFT_496267 [Hypoxylon sp. FL1150]